MQSDPSSHCKGILEAIQARLPRHKDSLANAKECA
jgi:hypothetical protein